jgi:hypothetical protein
MKVGSRSRLSDTVNFPERDLWLGTLASHESRCRKPPQCVYLLPVGAGA